MGVQGGVFLGFTWHKLEEESTQDHLHSDTSLWPQDYPGVPSFTGKTRLTEATTFGVMVSPWGRGQVQVSTQAEPVNPDTKLCGPLSGSGEQDDMCPYVASTANHRHSEPGVQNLQGACTT